MTNILNEFFRHVQHQPNSLALTSSNDEDIYRYCDLFYEVRSISKFIDKICQTNSNNLQFGNHLIAIPENILPPSVIDNAFDYSKSSVRDAGDYARALSESNEARGSIAYNCGNNILEEFPLRKVEPIDGFEHLDIDAVNLQRNNKLIVVVTLPCCSFRLIAYLACLRSQCVYCPLDPGMKSYDEVIKNLHYSLLITNDDFIKLKSQTLPPHRPVIAIESILDSRFIGEESLSYDIAQDIETISKSNISDPYEPIHLIFTGGTTSSSKAVLCDERGSLSSHKFRNNVIPFSSGDIVGRNMICQLIV
jgi:hypothetical protein